MYVRGFCERHLLNPHCMHEMELLVWKLSIFNSEKSIYAQYAMIFNGALISFFSKLIARKLECWMQSFQLQGLPTVQHAHSVPKTYKNHSIIDLCNSECTLCGLASVGVRGLVARSKSYEKSERRKCMKGIRSVIFLICFFNWCWLTLNPCGAKLKFQFPPKTPSFCYE